MNKFWMVWMEGNRDPQVKHPVQSAAFMEAERLARLHPGKTLWVLEAIDACKVNDVIWANQRPIDEPF